MDGSMRRQRIPWWRVATYQEARQHAEKDHVGNACRTVEIHSAAALPGDAGKAEIKGRGCGRRVPLRIQQCRFASKGLARGAMDRIDIGPCHMLRAQLIRASVPLCLTQSG